MADSRVLAVARDAYHRFSKEVVDVVTLVEGLGVAGDAHAGRTVRHRSRVAVDATVPNLRQVHLLQSSFLDEARAAGFDVGPGDLGENVLTSGLPLLGLPVGTRLRLGADAEVTLTGLRNPCRQIDDFRDGLLRLAVRRDASGRVDRRAGVMSVVTAGGDVRAGDPVRVVLPPAPHRRLERV